MNTLISEIRNNALFMGNVSKGSSTKETQNKDNFSEIFDMAQSPTDSYKKDTSVKAEETEKFQSGTNVQNKNRKTTEKLKEQTEAVKDIGNGKEIEEATAEAANEIVENVAETFGISVEEVENVLETLGLTVLDLLNSENLTQVVLALNPECDALTLMTNEELYADLKGLMDTAQELKNQIVQDFQLTTEEMNLVMNSMKENINEQLPMEELAQVAETQTDVVEVSNVRSDAVSVELVDSTTYDGTVIPKTENPQDIHSDSSEAKDDSGAAAGQNFKQDFVNQLADAVENTNNTSTSEYSVRGQDIINQITEHIRVHLKQDATEMELQLHPASLGNVKVQITSAGGVLTAVFTTENETVKSALESQLIQLKENFAQQGLKVESVEVNVSAHGFERSLDQQEQEQQRFEESRSKKGNRRIRLNGMEDIESILSEDMENDDRIVADMMIRNGNTVDYTV